MFTVDTNVLIYYAAGDAAVSALLFQYLEDGTRLLLPTVVAVEFTAFPKLTTKERDFFASLLAQLESVPLSLELAFRAGALRQAHNLKLGDAIVAATALETNSTLLTRNVRDFKKIALLKVMPV